MTAGRTLIGDAVLVEQVGQILHLVDACVQVVELGVFIEANGQCLHVAAVHTAVCKVALEGDAEVLCGLVPVGVACGDESAHVDDGILLGRHGHAVGEREDVAYNLLDGAVGLTGLAHLDEIGVFGETGRVENEAFAEFLAEGTHLTQVFERNGLSAGGIVGDCDDDERHLVALIFKHFLEFGYVDVPFERVFELRVFGFVDGTVNGGGMARFDVPFCGVEMRVSGYNIPLVYESRKEHILSGAALVGGDYVVETGDAVDGVAHSEERTGAGIAFVTHHHRRPLPVAHGACARVGQ